MVFSDNWFGEFNPQNDMHTMERGRFAFLPIEKVRLSSQTFCSMQFFFAVFGWGLVQASRLGFRPKWFGDRILDLTNVYSPDPDQLGIFSRISREIYREVLGKFSRFSRNADV